MVVMDYERIDDLQLGGYKIIQDTRGFCFGLDSVLLSHFAKDAHGRDMLDLCSGNGIVAILMAAKTKMENICALEIQKEISDMCCRSIELNNLEDRMKAVCADLKDAPAIFGKSSFDVITCNPPYMPYGSGLKNDIDSKTIARHEVMCNLEDIIKVSEALLRPSGKLYMVHRPERLVDMLSLMRAYNLEPKRLQMVHPSAHKKANIVLVEAAYKGGRELKMMPPLYVFDEDGNYTDEINDIYYRGKNL